MVSVVIPYYKNANSIRRTILSVLSQTFDDFEILIINDASPDTKKLKSILSELENSKIELVTHSTNKNGSAARNTGMNMAKGQFIAFLDADDEWSSDHLEKMIQKALLIRDLRKKCFYCKSLIKTDLYPDLILPLNEKTKTNSIATNLFIEDGFIQSSGLFITSNCKVRWNESLIRHQDYDFLFRLEKEGYLFLMSDHLGVTIHWEGNDITKKGGTWEYSLNYVTQYSEYFTLRESANFKYKNVIKPLLRSGKRKMSISLYFSRRTWINIPIKMQIEFLDLLIFRKPIILKFLSKIKKRLS